MYSKLEKLRSLYVKIHSDILPLSYNYFTKSSGMQKEKYKGIEYTEFKDLENKISMIAASLNMQFDEDRNYLQGLYTEYQKIIKDNFLPSSENNFRNNYDRANFENLLESLRNSFEESKIYEHCSEKYLEFINKCKNYADNLVNESNEVESLLNNESKKADYTIKKMDESLELIQNMNSWMNNFYIEMEIHYAFYKSYYSINIKPRVDKGEINYVLKSFPEWWHLYIVYGDDLVGADKI